MEQHLVAGRSFPEVYRVREKADLHEFLVAAVAASGGQLLYASDASRAPFYLGIQLDSEERVGVLIYPFRITRNSIHNRPEDEVRGQLRYGSEASWLREHPLGRDIAGVDVTVILGVDIEDGVFLGLDANLWDPLPMGISFYAKERDVEQARSHGWHVWEKVNHPGNRRRDPRSPTNLETLIAFTPERLLDYVRLERRASTLALDPALRYAVAMSMTDEDVESESSRHALEQQFNLTSAEILDIIGGRNRLSVGVRGGVAEHHLEQQLIRTPGVLSVQRLDADAMHDFDVALDDGTQLRVECKNASPKLTSGGDFRVEVQKTRSSKGDPASRFYSVDAFDVVAACVFAATGVWEFRFGLTAGMRRHATFGDRLAPIQTVTSHWSTTLPGLGGTGAS